MEMEHYSPAAARRRAGTSSSTPRTSPRSKLFEISGHLDWYAEGMYPPMTLDEERDADGHVRKAGAELLPQADELPDAQPDLRGARPVLPRAAAAAVRVRHRVPVREVGRRARHDPRARLHPGRRAHLLHPRADEGRAHHDAEVRPRPAQGLRARRLLPGAVDQEPGEVRRLRRGLGRGDRDPARRSPRRPGSTSCPTRAARRSTARRSRCRPRTRSAAPGRCRPSSSTSTCPSGSSSSTPRPTAAASGP